MRPGLSRQRAHRIRQDPGLGHASPEPRYLLAALTGTGKGRLPMHFVARRKLCLPASTGYRVKALGSQPLPCLPKALDPNMVHALAHDVVPALEKLGVLDRARPSVRPAVTLVFDARAGARPCSNVSPGAALPCSPGTGTSREIAD